MKVHNGDLYVECMQAADWSNTPEKRREVSPASVAAEAKAQKAAKVAVKQREAFMEKQTVREHEFKQRFEVAKKEAERRAHEKAMLREKEFEARFQNFASDNSTLAKEVEGAILADEAWRQRKRERLFDEWSMNIFQPMQDQINASLLKATDEEIEHKRRTMFQAFLDESNKKANGLFRDIIIESDYDPLQQAKDATLRYTKASVAKDPTKNRSAREQGDGMVQYLLASSKPREAPAERRLFVPVEMWGDMTATPWGRYSGDEATVDASGKPPPPTQAQLLAL